MYVRTGILTPEFSINRVHTESHPHVTPTLFCFAFCSPFCQCSFPYVALSSWTKTPGRRLPSYRHNFPWFGTWQFILRSADSTMEATTRLNLWEHCYQKIPIHAIFWVVLKSLNAWESNLILTGKNLSPLSKQPIHYYTQLVSKHKGFR